MVDEFHGFVDGPTGYSPTRDQQMCALPDASRAETLFLIVTIPHRDQAKNWCRSQQISVWIPVAARSVLPQHFFGRDFENRSRQRRQANCVNGQAVAVRLDVAPVPSDPALASLFHFRIRIHLMIGFGDYVDNPVSV
jgi:hypothetical protein